MNVSAQMICFLKPSLCFGSPTLDEADNVACLQVDVLVQVNTFLSVGLCLI